jgi:hypothetical protein
VMEVKEIKGEMLEIKRKRLGRTSDVKCLE